MGAVLDAVFGPRCDMHGGRVDAVFTVGALKVCSPCKRSLKAADRGQPPRQRGDRPYRQGQPPPLAKGPMGGRYVGPPVRDQRRK